MQKHYKKTPTIIEYLGFYLIPILAVFLVISLIVNVYQKTNSIASISSLNKKHSYKMELLSDSLNNQIESLKTQLELKTIHEAYGKISMSRERHNKPTKDEVWAFILTLDTWYPEYIMAQAIIESSCGNVMPMNSNNMFGMTVPRKRESVAINFNSSTDSYAKYNNWKEGVIDRVLWELFVFSYKKPTEKEYLEKIKNYAENPTYLETVKSIAKQYKIK